MILIFPKFVLKKNQYILKNTNIIKKPAEFILEIQRFFHKNAEFLIPNN